MLDAGVLGAGVPPLAGKVYGVPALPPLALLSLANAVSSSVASPADHAAAAWAGVSVCGTFGRFHSVPSMYRVGVPAVPRLMNASWLAWTQPLCVPLLTHATRTPRCS